MMYSSKISPAMLHDLFMTHLSSEKTSKRRQLNIQKEKLGPHNRHFHSSGSRPLHATHLNSDMKRSAQLDLMMTGPSGHRCLTFMVVKRTMESEPSKNLISKIISKLDKCVYS